MGRRARSPRLSARVRWTIRVVAMVLTSWLEASGIVLWQARSRAICGLDRRQWPNCPRFVA